LPVGAVGYLPPAAESRIGLRTGEARYFATRDAGVAVFEGLLKPTGVDGHDHDE
jgi:hypothetical protein